MAVIATPARTPRRYQTRSDSLRRSSISATAATRWATIAPSISSGPHCRSRCAPACERTKTVPCWYSASALPTGWATAAAASLPCPASPGRISCRGLGRPAAWPTRPAATPISGASSRCRCSATPTAAAFASRRIGRPSSQPFMLIAPDGRTSAAGAARFLSRADHRGAAGRRAHRRRRALRLARRSRRSAARIHDGARRVGSRQPTRRARYLDRPAARRQRTAAPVALRGRRSRPPLVLDRQRRRTTTTAPKRTRIT